MLKRLGELMDHIYDNIINPMSLDIWLASFILFSIVIIIAVPCILIWSIIVFPYNVFCIMRAGLGRKG